jgi:membrane protein YqaA with SNARE-associated domain
MNEILQILGLFLLSSTKFLFAPATIILSGYNFWQTILISTTGGWFGVYVFYFFGKLIMDYIFRKYFNKTEPKQVKKKFSKTNKMIVKTKTKYGIYGLAIITPVVISIPIGAIIAAKYYRKNKATIPILMSAVFAWSVILTTFFSLF